MSIKSLFCCILFSFTAARAQELFPLNEPASTLPKGVLGLRFYGTSYQELDRWRNLGMLRLMYGLTSKFTIMVSESISNHHARNLPPDLITHTHNGNSTTTFTQNFQRGLRYPYLYNGTYLFAKYRFLSIDGQNRHLRVAAYGEWSHLQVAHDEAEPNLMDDTRGYGGGLIVTCLRNRFAASFTSGVIIPGAYHETVPDPYGGILNTDLFYGNAVKYNLSFGYRLSPNQYKDYSQDNWNLYLELQGKAYKAARVYQNGTRLESSTPFLAAGNYVDVFPGIQWIHDSNLRVELSVGLNLISRSYTHFYPVYSLGIQRYFYFR